MFIILSKFPVSVDILRRFAPYDARRGVWLVTIGGGVTLCLIACLLCCRVAVCVGWCVWWVLHYINTRYRAARVCICNNIAYIYNNIAYIY